jgi:peptide/nickel transport system substrate-binding protein
MKRLFHALAGGLALFAGAAMAQETEITLGMQLEPPILDPTAGGCGVYHR